jgi:anti-repressor protein
MQNQLTKVFNYQTKEVRTVIKDNEPWFVAKDVCEILELGNSREAVGKLDDEEKGAEKVDTLGGK